MEYKPGVQHSNADVLSHLPMPAAISEFQEAGQTILLMENLYLSPVTARQIRQWMYGSTTYPSNSASPFENAWTITGEDRYS